MKREIHLVLRFIEAEEPGQKRGFPRDDILAFFQARDLNKKGHSIMRPITARHRSHPSSFTHRGNIEKNDGEKEEQI